MMVFYELHRSYTLLTPTLSSREEREFYVKTSFINEEEVQTIPLPFEGRGCKSKGFSGESVLFCVIKPNF